MKGHGFSRAEDDAKLTEEIRAGVHYQILEDANGTIEQILIPVNDELQIHITKDKKNVDFEIIPIITETKKEALMITDKFVVKK